ncbi:L-alanine exporter AlaE [Microbulbifer agarilyticus]|uniref:L-alanine exporter AlaE n=1 Tax=Microbulbifer agarilyticus TaxID=260552 RepID=UPI001C9673FA|nr:L-alanine exporter AlaE [Microbulbifer agarilyticus]MBY6191199.1 L-alanine exporter AlaE [Microbulbifer agarilyticus]MBY6211800.1 L-alanine exporter AlaE [Microbulbifer agarilyticus]MCA0893175.1 L-alanine exporter AlaE [Microbulbifer agarilyticus]
MSPQSLSQATEAIPVSPPVMVLEDEQPVETTQSTNSQVNERRNRRTRWNEWLLDVFAMNSFSWAIAIPIELLLAGMSWSEHLKIRLLAVVFNSVIARPFSMYRAWIVKRFGRGGALHNYAVDTFVFLSFQLPLYTVNMMLGGASMAEIATACITFAMIAGVLGRPYGIYLDFLRRVWARRSAGTHVTDDMDTATCGVK